MSRNVPCILSDLPKPDLLHTMQIGMLDHFQKWILHFMMTYQRLDQYNAPWLSVPAYHDITPKTKSYENDFQWNGQQMKEIRGYRLGVSTQLQSGGSPALCPIFNRAVDCTRVLLEFYMYAGYTSHHDAALSFMDDALCRFHTINDVFLLRQPGKMGKAKANALKIELSMKRPEMNAWRDYISHEIEVSKESDTDFDVSKIHLMSHWVEQIRRYGAFKQYFAEINAQAHEMNLKYGWNASNHNLNSLPQVITIQRHILCFEIRVLNLQALVQCRVNSATICKVLPSDADLAAPLSSQSYAKPEFMGPLIRHDGKHPDALIKDFIA
ncbi:hypothetical protein BDD12DRAFT_884597 [Trichophaea hybrida]|nr:hypothetical protein BDD12DRAFT_884597 [Trichophaea hybrida]